MELVWSYSTDALDWEELLHLYKIAPLGHKKLEDLKTVYGNSKYKCLVYKDHALIGVGRALSDGIDCSYICDIAIHPDFQGMGIGKEIVTKLIEFSKDHNKIILYASPGKEPFYAKLGFLPMNTAMAIFKDKEDALDREIIYEV
ncbi:GNAT family N-acetyltransferase [Sulfurospirillum arsenophilum]|uniref:GNAT family N-acetyltransferase n=1 Tax=Sulfurospirillum arsenophilum TaxID=56698 RepID=UPI0005AB592A|nr:GNAT family N-acetyltransferase [Sulfurospirillum arsenophilum]